MSSAAADVSATGGVALAKAAVASVARALLSFVSHHRGRRVRRVLLDSTRFFSCHWPEPSTHALRALALRSLACRPSWVCLALRGRVLFRVDGQRTLAAQKAMGSVNCQSQVSPATATELLVRLPLLLLLPLLLPLLRLLAAALSLRPPLPSLPPHHRHILPPTHDLVPFHPIQSRSLLPRDSSATPNISYALPRPIATAPRRLDAPATL